VSVKRCIIGQDGSMTKEQLARVKERVTESYHFDKEVKDLLELWADQELKSDRELMELLGYHQDHPLFWKVMTKAKQGY